VGIAGTESCRPEYGCSNRLCG